LISNFLSTRYAHYDLPEDVAHRLMALYFVRDLDDLQTKFAQARQWFYQAADSVDWDAVRKQLEAA
jgi:hypothetical protein